MTNIDKISTVLITLILAGVVARTAFQAFQMIMEQEFDIKPFRNLIIVAVLASTVFTLKNLILSYYR